MIGVASLLVILTLALVITRVATVALRTTGLSHEAARFQARSAFSGVGFTTAESEDIVNHPARRRIVLMLMMLSGAGVVTALASLLLSFARTSGTGQTVTRLLVLLAGMAVLGIVGSSRWLDVRLSRVIERALVRWTDLDAQDYVRLLRLYEKYSIAELVIEADDWIAGRAVRDLALTAEGVVVLGIRTPDGSYVGAPDPNRQLEPLETVILYGRTAGLDELQSRKIGADGDRAHATAAAKHIRERARARSDGTSPMTKGAHARRAGHRRRRSVQ